jgi:hypothetical protein
VELLPLPELFFKRFVTEAVKTFTAIANGAFQFVAT